MKVIIGVKMVNRSRETCTGKINR